MNTITLQIQSVIYKNEKESLIKAIKAIKNAISVFNKKGQQLEAALIYGDASPDPIFDVKDIDEIRDIIDGIFEFKYKKFGFNTGTAKGHNILGAECSTEYMMIMNPDIILEPSCLKELFTPFKSENVGMVEARQTPLEHAKCYDFEAGDTEWASTACTVFKTAIFKMIQGFDADTFFMYCDDLDFSWRLRLAGYRIVYQPSALVYHAKNLAINGKWKPTSAEVYYSAEAAILLAYKWSNNERAEQLVAQYKRYGGEAENKAAREFEKRKMEQKLPVQLDTNHDIAKFVGDDYCMMRFHF